MIRQIEDPRLDYLEIAFRENESEFSSPNQKTKYDLLRETVFSVFKMGFEDRKRDGYFQFFERNGVSFIVKKGRQKVIFKGFFWMKTNAFSLVKMFMHYLEKLHIKGTFQRMDIRRNFFSDRTDEPFDDVRKGFWINRSSVESFYQPEIFNKGNPESVGSYFKSEHFVINTYDKTNQMQSFERKISRLKKEDKKRPLQTAVSRHKELYGDKKVFRFEVKITSPEIAEGFHPSFDLKSTEVDFCYSVLEGFSGSYPMKKERVESKKFKQFFERQPNGNKKRKSKSTKSNAKNRN